MIIVPFGFTLSVLYLNERHVSSPCFTLNQTEVKLINFAASLELW